MWIRNGDEPMRVSPLHSMLVRMPRGTTGTRSEPQCAQPARTSTRVFRSQTSLCRLASTLASESALCEPLHGRVCTRSSIYSIVILSVRVRPCGRHVYSTQCRHFATSHELWESGAYFHKVLKAPVASPDRRRPAGTQVSTRTLSATLTSIADL